MEFLDFVKAVTVDSEILRSKQLRGTLLKTDSKFAPEKMDVWETLRLPFLDCLGLLSRAMLLLGRVNQPLPSVKMC